MLPDPKAALRMALRAALMEQAVDLGMGHGDAMALVERLQRDGTIHAQAETLDSQLATIQRVAIENKAMGIVLAEQSRTAGAQPVPTLATVH